MSDNLRTGILNASLRTTLVLLGLVGAVLSAASLRSSWAVAPVKDAMASILANDRFRPGALKNLLEVAQAPSGLFLQRSDHVRAEGLVRVKVSEELIERKSAEQVAEEVALAEKAIRSSLVLNPGDSLLWFMLYSVVLTREGDDSNARPFLEESYEVGPLEGWIALRRNGLALAARARLAEKTRTLVDLEFAGLVASFFLDHAVRSLTMLRPDHQARLLDRLSDVDIVAREAFGKALAKDQILLEVPGVKIDRRPWW